MLKWAFFSRQGRVLNFFCSILPSTCPSNKLIHTKNNVGEKNKRVGREQKDFIWTHSATFQLQEHVTAGAAQGWGQAAKVRNFSSPPCSKEKTWHQNYPVRPTCDFLCQFYSLPFFHSALTRWSQRTKEETNPFNIEVSEPAKKKKALFPTVLFHLFLHFREGAWASPKTFLWPLEVPR